MKGVLLTLLAVTSVLEITPTAAQPDMSTTTTRTGNTCEKTVSERVPKIVYQRVTVLRKGTKKCGFMWLKTCSTYSIGFRTVSRLEYRVKTYQIKVCCDGTDVNGNCTTDETPCTTRGKYGQQCDLDCDCDRNYTLPEVCDRQNGYCFCMDGYGGAGCRQDLNQTIGPEYDPVDNVTDSFPPKSQTSDVAGGGDLQSRAIIIVIVLVVIVIIVVLVFCCCKRRARNKPTSGGSTSVSDDFVVSLHPAQVDSAQYVTPEEIRKRKKEQEALKYTEDLTEKPCDYVEMRSVSGSSKKPEVTSVASSLAHKALEQEVDSGRQSIAYANFPSSGSLRQYSDTSHYYLEDADPKLSISPTYSLVRRQESGDSAYDDDGYCTSPTHGGDDINLHYSMPRYFKPKPAEQDTNRESLMENIYESPEPNFIRNEDSDKVNAISNPEYANVSQSIGALPGGIYSHLPHGGKHSDDGYDHIAKNISVV